MDHGQDVPGNGQVVLERRRGKGDHVMTGFEVLHVPLEGLDIFPPLHLLEAHPIGNRVLGIVLVALRRLVAGRGRAGQGARGKELVGPAVAVEIPVLPLDLVGWPGGCRPPGVVTQDEILDPRLGDAVVDAFEEMIVPLLFQNPEVVPERVEPIVVTVQGPVEVVAMLPGPEHQPLRGGPNPRHQCPIAEGAGQIVVEPPTDLKSSELGADRGPMPILAFPERTVGRVEDLVVPVRDIAPGAEIVEGQEWTVGQHVGPGSTREQLPVVHEEGVERHPDQHPATNVGLIGKGRPHRHLGYQAFEGRVA